MQKKVSSVVAARSLLSQAAATKVTMVAYPEGKTSYCRESKLILMQAKEMVCQEGVYMHDLDHM